MVSVLRKVVSIAMIVAVVVNMIFFAFQYIGAGVFWGVIVAAAVLAYVALPKLGK